MKIYISIPMSGHDTEAQMAKAAKIANGIEALGHTPINPFIIGAMLPQSTTYADFMGHDIAALLKCDGIYMCKGWESSRGCRLELEASKIYNLDAFTRLDQIPEFEPD